jgi:hypothetical protein
MNVMRLKREGVTHLMKGVTYLMRGGYHHHEEEKRGIGAAAPLWAAAPFSYKRWHLLLSFFRHLVLPIPYLVAPPWLLLKRSAAKILSHQHLEKWKRSWSVWWIPSSTAPLDRGSGGDFGEPYM